MSEDASEEFGEERVYTPPPPSVRLVIVPDLHDKDWAHFYTPRALTTTFDSLPHGLANKLRPCVVGLMQRKITRLDFDSSRKHPALADSDLFIRHEFDLQLLKKDEDFEDLFSAVIWWIEREQRKLHCGFDTYHGVQAHKTWTCECGAIVDVEKKFVEMCNNPNCPTWEKYEFCTGKRYNRNLRLA
ncbi:MAG: hypothetical protein NTX72_05965 [Candidatus Uhrbacteria bacterium]|nr:hypothetical protein [Candidatus Uhrbacteria bacterium]